MKPEPEPGALITAKVFHICSPSTYPTIFSSRVQQPHVPLSESVAHEWSSPSSVKFAKLCHSEHELKAQPFSSLQSTSVMTSKAANILHQDFEFVANREGDSCKVLATWLGGFSTHIYQ